MAEALIFDLDGVVVHSEETRFKVLQNLCLKYNIQLKDSAIHEMVGVNTYDFFQKVLHEVEKGKIETIISDYEKTYKAHILSFITPIEETVRFIKGYSGSVPLALASMGTSEKVREIIEHLGISHSFASILSADDVAYRKPQPEIYLKTAESLGVNPHMCRVVEDSFVGALAAIQAKMQCFIFLNGMNKKEAFKDLPIAGFVVTTQDLQQLVS